MYANAVEPLVILAAAVALGFSARAIFLQRQSLQASLFSDTIKKMDDVLDQQISYEKEGRVMHWYIGLLDAFEYFAFFANRRYLSRAMRKYPRSTIIENLEDASIRDDVKKHFQGRPVEQLSELRKYYKRYAGKNSPI